MIRKHTSIIPEHVCIIFELPASVWADRVYVTGEFNDWRENDLPMRQGRDGVWRLALDLPMDRHFQFRYLVDGQWKTDWQADGSEENIHGSQNSVVVTTLPQREITSMHSPTGSSVSLYGSPPMCSPLHSATRLHKT